MEVKLLKEVDNKTGSEYIVMQYEFKDGFNNYLRKSNAQVKSLDNVIAFNKLHADKTMPFFTQDILEECAAKGDLTSREYLDALSNALSVRKIIDSLLKAQQIDAICGISTGMACFIDLFTGDYNTGFWFPTPAAIAGYPHITVPMGRAHELPVGLSFIAAA